MSRITPGTVIVGIFAVLFGLVGAYGVRKYFQTEKPAPLPPTAPARQVVPVASGDLESGRTLVLGDVAIWRLLPAEIDKMIKDGKLPAQYMTNPQQIIGRILKKPLKQSAAFQTTDLYPEGSGPTIAEKLAPGLRAVTIPVEGTGALGGYDGPGSYVDIVFRAQPDAKAGIPETTVTLLEGVQVLAVEEADKRAPPGAKLSNRVTLAVTAAQANALKIAENRGTFSLSLRSPEDVEVAASNEPQTLDRLLNVPVREQFTTSIYRGGSPSAVSFVGTTVARQPAVQLPIAGVLQLRAAQQTTAIEKKDGSGTDESSEPAVPTPPAEPAATEPAAPAEGVKTDEPAAADTQAAEPSTSDADDLATVTVQIPVSVLLSDKKQKSEAAKVPDSNPVPTSPAPAAESPKAEPSSGAAAPAPADRPRKMLSEIRGRTGKKSSAKRTGS